ncbi:MAG: amidohydrolase family protein [Armatimonadota bacterium]
MSVYDTHIHLFEKPYCDLFDNSHIKNGIDGNLHLYEQYRASFGIDGAFVICYEDGDCPQNNSFVESIKQGRGWIYSFAHTRPDPSTMLDDAKRFHKHGHFGLSCYLERDDDAVWLASPEMASFWDYLQETYMPISFNLSAFQCAPIADALKKRPDVTVLISHMARPKVTDGKLDENDYAPLLRLAECNGAYVKLSGFYAFVVDGWRYPQSELFRAVDKLKDTFGVNKLVFASDFSPVLEYNTYRQALELLRVEYKGFTPDQLEDIYCNNARRIIAQRGE